jgi:hypothetical protein
MKNVNLNKLSDATQQALLASVAIVAKPYESIAASVANYATGQKEASDTAKAGIWGQFKRALGIAIENEHSPSTMRTALESACALAGVPSGTIRSYLPTLEKLAEEVDAETLTPAEAVGISIKDARARYKVAPTEAEKALKAARERLAEVTEGWTAEEIHLLCELATESKNAEGETEQEQAEPQVANG